MHTRPARRPDLLLILGLLTGEFQPKPPTRQHNSAVLLRLDITLDHRQRSTPTVATKYEFVHNDGNRDRSHENSSRSTLDERP